MVRPLLTFYVYPNLGPGTPRPVEDPHVARVCTSGVVGGPRGDSCSIRREGDGDAEKVRRRLTVYVRPNLGPRPTTLLEDPHVARIGTVGIV